MGFILTVTTAFVVWIVVWALTAKGFDAFMITGAIVIVAVTIRGIWRNIVVRH
jgi:hypothetical protein